MSDTVGALSSYTNALMFAVGAKVQAAMENDVLWKNITQSTSGIEVGPNGNYYIKSTNIFAYAYNGRFISEGGSRPQFDPATTDVSYMGLYKVWLPLRLTGLARQAGQLIGDRAVTLESIERTGLEEDWKKKCNEAILSQHSGALCYVVTGGTTSVVMDDCSRLRIGMTLESVTSSSHVWYNAKVTDIDRTTNTVTVSGQTGTAVAGDTVCRNGEYGLSPYGLLDLVNDNADVIIDTVTIAKALTTYAGLSRVTYPKHKATINRLNGDSSKTVGFLDIDATFAKAYSRMQKLPQFKLGIGHIDTCLAVASAMNLVRFQEATQPMTRAQIGVGGIDITSMQIEGSKITLMPVIDMPRGIILWLNTSPQGLSIRKVGEPNFVPGDNGQIFHFNGNDAASATDTYTASWMWTMAPVGVPIEHAMTSGIAIPAGLGVGY